MLLSRALKTEIYSSATICEKHFKVLGKEYPKYVGYKCSWHNHEKIMQEIRAGFKRRKTARSLVAITRPQSFFLFTHRNLFFPFGTKFCYDCRINEIDEIFEDMNPEEFSTPTLFQYTLALWQEEPKEPEDLPDPGDPGDPAPMEVLEHGNEPSTSSGTNIPSTPGPSRTIMQIPSAPMAPININPSVDMNVGQIASQMSNISVTPSSTQSSTGLPSQLDATDIAGLTRKAVKDLLQLGGFPLPNPPPAIILNNGKSASRVKTYKKVIGRTIASIMKLTVTQKNEVRRLWNIMRETDAVTKHLPGSLDPGIAMTEYILAWNGSNNNNKRLELLSLILTMVPASQLKKFNADGKSSGLRFNPAITDRQICKAKIHR